MAGRAEPHVQLLARHRHVIGGPHWGRVHGHHTAEITEKICRKVIFKCMAHFARVVAVYTHGAELAAPAEPGATNAGDEGSAERPVEAAIGTVGGDSITPNIAPPDPSPVATQAVIAAQP